MIKAKKFHVDSRDQRDLQNSDNKHATLKGTNKCAQPQSLNTTPAPPSPPSPGMDTHSLCLQSPFLVLCNNVIGAVLHVVIYHQSFRMQYILLFTTRSRTCN